jgi:predicted secreted Zn-dependent protease
MKFEYQVSQMANLVWVTVNYASIKNKTCWRMTFTRNRETLVMEGPIFYVAKEGELYTKIDKGAIPKYVRTNFDCVMPKAKTMLILESDK